MFLDPKTDIEEEELRRTGTGYGKLRWDYTPERRAEEPAKPQALPIGQRPSFIRRALGPAEMKEAASGIQIIPMALGETVIEGESRQEARKQFKNRLQVDVAPKINLLGRASQETLGSL